MKRGLLTQAEIRRREQRLNVASAVVVGLYFAGMLAHGLGVLL